MSGANPNLSGVRIGDRFVLETLAGRGGMGTVWRARDTARDEIVAVKLMRGTEHADRFLRESQLLAELQHPRVVRYIDHGVTEDGEPYLAMEWLSGVDLAQKLAGAPLPVADAVRVIAHAAEALAVAHARGIVHRDIKPSNLYLPRGQIDGLKVLDFGIARAQLASQVMTRTGAALGTPGYMAPEQARGERDVDARADVFALGCVLFEALAGRPPFTGEHLMAVLAKVLFEEAPRVRELCPEAPVELEQLVARMLSKRPAERPADAAAVLAELAAIELGQGQPVARPTQASLTTGEQRLLTVVIAGRAPGSADTIDPTDETAATGALATQFDASVALAPYGATVERLADGTIIAVLAGQGAATDLAAQAARCALALRRLRRDVPMALATGRGTVAGRLPVGEVIDRGVRLLSRTVSDAGDDAAAIRLDETTAGLLDLRFEIGGDSRGLLLHGEREVVESTRTLLGKPTPCVGRERELALLDGVYAECIADPVAHAVLVTAPPGMGKSRLISEFLRRRKAEGSDVEIWIGRADPLSAGSSLGMLAQALRRVCGMLDGERLAVRQHKLRARVARHVPAAERTRVFEFLAEIVGCEVMDHVSDNLRAARQNPVLMHDQMRRAWEDFACAEAAAHPVVLVLEDLQWGDLPTTKFVGGALRRAGSLPLMILAAARPEITERFPGLWTGKQMTQLQLGDLGGRAGEKLIRGVLGDVSAETVARMLAHAGGNAFYLEELIRAVADGKGDTLPPTVLAMVQARLEALDPAARRTLRAASVFGQVFWADGVAKLVGASGGLDALVERELVERRGESRFPDQDEYLFRHAIVRDAAYTLLTDEDRVLGHRLAGEWLEAHGELDAIALAEHFEAGGDRDRAATWYTAAATQALDANDFENAIARARRGIACGVTGELRGQLRAVMCQAQMWQGAFADAVVSGHEALAEVPAGSAVWFDLTAVLARISISTGNSRMLLEVYDALVRQKLDGTDERCVLAHVACALRLMFTGDYERADHLLAPLHAVMRDPSANDNVRGAVCEVIAHRMLTQGDLVGALRMTQDSVEAYRAAGNLRDAAYEQIGVALVEVELGAYEAAERTLRAILGDASAPAGTTSTVVKLNLGLVLGYLGRPDAEPCLLDAIRELDAGGDMRLAANGRGYLIMVREMRGELAAALAAAADAEARLATVEVPSVLAQTLAAVARVHLQAKDPSAALARVRDVERVLASINGLLDEGESYVWLAIIDTLFAAGEAADARAALAKALARILERAAKMTDPAWRASFLERVPENARIVALAREHGIG
jgi:tetratricopeptide (TPR) repeat protein